MPKERFYSPSSLIGEKEIVLADQEYHHLLHVMRMKEGEEVELVNGQGSFAKGIITHLGKKQGVITLHEAFNEDAPQKNLILYQAIPRIQRLDFIVEKGTELGMTHLYLFPGEKSERKDLTPKHLEGLKAQAIAALKQSGRLWLPTIELRPPIKQWTSLPSPTFFGDLAATTPLTPQLSSAAVCIGPESGFSFAEITHLKEIGAQGKFLHANVLRTDTAALAALVILSQ